MTDLSPTQSLLASMNLRDDPPQSSNIHSFSIRLPRDQFAWIEAMARLTSTSRNAVATRFIESGIKQLIEDADPEPDPSDREAWEQRQCEYEHQGFNEASELLKTLYGARDFVLADLAKSDKADKAKEINKDE